MKKSYLNSRLIRLAAPMLLLAVSACATKAAFDERTNARWVGKTQDDLVAALGVADSTIALSDGGKVLVYSRAETVVYKGQTTLMPISKVTQQSNSNSQDRIWGYAGQYAHKETVTEVAVTRPDEQVSYSCLVRFRMSPTGIVASVASEGNACRAKRQ